MSVVVFVGPSLQLAAARELLDATYLPPAGQGDVYRAACTGPRVIAIIDGLFDTQPAVWHKEILWAMQQGVHVFGSASMGALRAAELAAFGMEGVGAIFAAFARGALEDDDEVAVAHAPAELGFRAHSTAMVNMRATLTAAAEQGVIGPETHAALERSAKACFYPERSYARLLSDAKQYDVPDDEISALRAWLPHGQVDQKRMDALELLRLIGSRLTAGLEPKRVAYHFEQTRYWEHLRQITAPASPAGSTDSLPSAVLEEVRLMPTLYRQVYTAALNRALAQTLAEHTGHTLAAESVHAAAQTLLADRALGSAGEEWLAEREIDSVAFAQIAADEAYLGWAQSWGATNVRPRLLAQIKLQDDYPRWRARANDKLSVLRAAGLSEPSLAEAGIDQAALLRWHFAAQQQPVPADLTQFVRGLGYANEYLFIKAVLREYCYQRLRAGHTTLLEEAGSSGDISDQEDEQ